MSLDIENSRAKLQEMAQALKNTKKLLIITHDNPDPDSMSSALALAYIVKNLFKIPAFVKYGGIVGRPENKAMVRLLGLKVSRIHDRDIKSGTDFAFVDMQPNTGNCSFSLKKKPAIIIDHHALRKTTRSDFIDIRINYGATASILTEYLLAAGLDIPKKLATALAYGISSETQDLGREASDVDIQAYLALYPNTNKKHLAQIIHPKLPIDHFLTLNHALHHSRIHKNIICTQLGEIQNPDSVAFIADFMLRLERMSWSLCIGRYENRLILSIRTSSPKAHAGRLLRKLLQGKGTAGGHGMIAGGQVPCSMEHEQCTRTEVEIIQAFIKKISGAEPETMTPLLLTESSKAETAA